MSPRVVDGLELVEIDDEERRRAPRRRQRLFELCGERPAVGESGEAVVVRQPGQLQLRGLPGRDVPDVRDEPSDRGFLDQVGDDLFHPSPGTAGVLHPELGARVHTGSPEVAERDEGALEVLRVDQIPSDGAHELVRRVAELLLRRGTDVADGSVRFEHQCCVGRSLDERPEVVLGGLELGLRPGCRSQQARSTKERQDRERDRCGEHRYRVGIRALGVPRGLDDPRDEQRRDCERHATGTDLLLGAGRRARRPAPPRRRRQQPGADHPAGVEPGRPRRGRREQHVEEVGEQPAPDPGDEEHTTREAGPGNADHEYQQHRVQDRIRGPDRPHPGLDGRVADRGLHRRLPHDEQGDDRDHCHVDHLVDVGAVTLTREPQQHQEPDRERGVGREPWHIGDGDVRLESLHMHVDRPGQVPQGRETHPAGDPTPRRSALRRPSQGAAEREDPGSEDHGQIGDLAEEAVRRDQMYEDEGTDQCETSALSWRRVPPEGRHRADTSIWLLPSEGQKSVTSTRFRDGLSPGWTVLGAICGPVAPS